MSTEEAALGAAASDSDTDTGSTSRVLPRLSNSERSWFKGLANRIDKAALQVSNLQADTTVSHEQLQEVQQDILKHKQNAHREWEMIKADFVARNRDDAQLQATARWTDLQTQLSASLATLQAMLENRQPPPPAPPLPPRPDSRPSTPHTTPAAPVVPPVDLAKVLARVDALEQELSQKQIEIQRAEQYWRARLNASAIEMRDVQAKERQEHQTEVRRLKDSLRRTEAAAAAADAAPNAPGSRPAAPSTPSLDELLRGLLRHTVQPDPPPPPARNNKILQRFATQVTALPPELHNPYAPADEDESDHFYTTRFPFPFNKPPRADSDRINHPNKLDALVVTFSGREEDFSSWMALYIPSIHRARCPMEWKTTALQKCMNKEDERLKDFAEGMGGSNNDYVRAIHKLVKTYGHPQGLLAARMKELETITRVEANNFRQLEKWHTRMERLVDLAEDMGRVEELQTQQIYEQNIAKMDQSLAREYFQWCKTEQVTKGLLSLFAWLDEYLDVARDAKRQAAPDKTPQSLFLARGTPPSPPPPSSPRSGPGRRSRTPCPLDNQQHGLAECPLFRQMRPDERKAKLTEWNRCFSCLNYGHTISRCQKGMRCSRCSNPHHYLLHGAGPRRAPPPPRVHFPRGNEPPTGGRGEEEDARAYTAQKGSKCRIALQTLPVLVHNGRSKEAVNMMMDQGATGAFMSERLARRLGVQGYTVESTVTGFDGATLTGPAVIANVQIQDIAKNSKHWIQVQVTKDPASSYQPFDWAKHKTRYSHLRDLPLSSPVPEQPVELMLGMDTPELIKSLVPDVGGGERDQPIARLTRLGWVVGGPTGVTDGTAPNNLLAFFLHHPWLPDPGEQNFPWRGHSFLASKTSELSSPTADAREPPVRPRKGLDEETHQLVARMWEVDVTATKRGQSWQDEKVFHFLREHLKQEDGRYILPTLWKPGEPALPNNFGFALKRLKALSDGKIWKNEKVRQEYLDHRQKWEADDHIEQVATANPSTDTAYYLPHFPVVRLEKTSSQVRPVMDAAARGAAKKSLNDALQKGPKLVNELVTVLLRFRRHRIAVAADVKKMFYQIALEPADRDYHRFLWWGPDEQTPLVFRWKVHPFGSAASPCIAIFTIKEHARRHREAFPRAAETVIHSTLVDDNLDSVDTPQEAIQLFHELTELYQLARMELGKFISNSTEVLHALPQEKVAPSLDVAEFCTKDLQLPLVKALGVFYASSSDEFSFHMEPPDVKKWSRRTILTHEAKLYDPHGLISPHIAKARMILQLTWREKLGWDDPLPTEILQMWTDWLAACSSLPLLRFPRCLRPATAPEHQLRVHIFCDASSEAYAAAAYGVTDTSSRLILSKVKMAPLKLTSIPRLELMAAVLGTEIAEALHAALAIPVSQIQFWTDSMNVICWLAADSRSLHTFVGTRIAHIQEASDVRNWRWVDTKNNPADIPSRGLTAEKLLNNQLWLCGPPFLLKDKSEWPHPQEKTETKEVLAEVRKGAAFLLHHPTIPLTDGYSPSPADHPLLHLRSGGWMKLLRITAWCLRWRRRSRGGLSPEELQLAERATIWNMQRTALARTVDDLVSVRVPSNRSTLLHLRPALDEAGLLRLNSRLRYHDHIPVEERHPLIIPKDHPLTSLLILHAHLHLLHAGANHTRTSLAKKFWIVHGQTAIRKVISRCIQCRRQKAQPSTQEMAPLPLERLPDQRPIPFQASAIDAAGPFLILRGDNTEKVYFVLFTCLTFRAVHLEPLDSMSATSFLLALDRFVARRGCPATILSDNGTNFRAAHGQLRRLWKEAREATQIWRRYEKIKWSFTPPYGPHFGGIYERLIAATKRTLYHIFPPKKAVRSEHFHTALVVTEGILNSRPLTYFSSEPDAPRPVAPADFLGAQPYSSLAPVPRDSRTAQHTWRQLQILLDRLWRRLAVEIRPYLQTITKWRKPQREFQPDDVVAFLEEDERGLWPLGRVLEVEKSTQDHKVRKLIIKVGSAVYRRPVSHVALLLPSDQTLLEEAPLPGSSRTREEPFPLN